MLPAIAGFLLGGRNVDCGSARSRTPSRFGRHSYSRTRLRAVGRCCSCSSRRLPELGRGPGKDGSFLSGHICPLLSSRGGTTGAFYRLRALCRLGSSPYLPMSSRTPTLWKRSDWPVG